MSRPTQVKRPRVRQREQRGRAGRAPPEASGVAGLGGRPVPRWQRFAGLPYPRRQQLRRLTRAAGAAAASALTVILAVAVALAGLTLLACALLLVAVAAGLSARHWTRLAGRAAVGARSEAEVR